MLKKLHLEKLAFIGDIVTLLCCLGFGPMLSVLSAIGAGFLINDAILAPLLAAFLVLGAVGLYVSHRHHRRWGPIVLHAAGAAAVFVFTFIAYFQPLIWVGVVGLLGAAIWDVVLRRRCRPDGETCEVPRPEGA